MTHGDAGSDINREFAAAAMVGLSDHPRWLPCRFLYDERGSTLFDLISTTPEYYLTRTESAILAAAGVAISEMTGPVTVVEFGAGTSTKTGHLLRAYERIAPEVHYVPVDVSAAALARGSRVIAGQHPTVLIESIHGSYEAAFPLLARLSPAMLVFLGSTIGNFNQTEAAIFWTAVTASLAPGDFVLLGVDLVKDPVIINAAYNDATGYSAEFTRNIFVRMNRELGTNLDLEQIAHEATYDPQWQRVEMYARFTAEQVVRPRRSPRGIRIGAGERIMTEISRKFRVEEVEQNLECYGLRLRRAFTDERNWFAVLLLQRQLQVSSPEDPA